MHKYIFSGKTGKSSLATMDPYIPNKQEMVVAGDGGMGHSGRDENKIQVKIKQEHDTQRDDNKNIFSLSLAVATCCGWRPL